MKERTQTSSEMGIGCQRSGYWAVTNHLSGRGLVQAIKELSSAAGHCARRRCALIRQLANTGQINLSGIVEWYIVFKTFGSIKGRTQTSSEMGIGCQRSGYWAVTNHLMVLGSNYFRSVRVSVCLSAVKLKLIRNCSNLM